MKKFKDLKACISLLTDLHARGDLEPGQKQSVEQVIERLRQLRRKRNPSQADMFRFFQEVTEKLVQTFIR
jgi:hypothetical protein